MFYGLKPHQRDPKLAETSERKILLIREAGAWARGAWPALVPSPPRRPRVLIKFLLLELCPGWGGQGGGGGAVLWELCKAQPVEMKLLGCSWSWG